MSQANLLSDSQGSANAMPENKSRSKWGSKLLNGSAIYWFVVTVVGQWVFGLYVSAFYGITSAKGDLAAWTKQLPHGYEAGNTLGNTMLVLHLLPAAIMMFCGPLQLLPKLRAKYPKFHRINGRIFIATAFTLALTGLYLSLSGRKVIGEFPDNSSILINAILILACIFMAFRTAIKRNFAAHRRWALRLFVACSGVWLFRIGLMFWLVVHGGPVGFDFKTFTGPFLTILGWTVYVFDLLILEVYLRSKASRSQNYMGITGIMVIVISLAMTIGVFGATMGMWLKRVQGAIG